MSGSMSKRAARASGGMVLEPNLSQVEAGGIIGQSIPDGAWSAIRRAFHSYGSRQDALKTSKASRSKGDDQSWHTRKDAATKAIEAAMQKVESARSRHGGFLDEASENHSLETFGQSYTSDNSARRMLDDAFMKMFHALVIIERSNPQEIETPTAAHSRDMLVNDIHAALVESGAVVRLSSGFELGQMEIVRTKDLTAFEALIAQFGIGDDRKPAAFSAWLWAILSDGKKQG
jgi:hypothetical protein